MKSVNKPILFLPLLLLMAACSNEVNQEELIRAAVQLKKEQWESAQMAQCKEKIYNKAEDYVDSMLVAVSLDDKLDTILKPVKPTKPFKPSFKSKPDSVIVDPIYKKEE
jgi:hypothetical protein